MPAVSAAQVPDGSPRVYVWGSIAIDLEAGRGRAGQTFAIRDCSDSDNKCLDGGMLRLTTPRLCNGYAQGAFGEGELKTEVLRVEEGPEVRARLDADLPNSPMFLLGNSARPNVVYVFSRYGMQGLYWDPLGKEDLIAVARAEGLPGLARTGQSADFFYFPAQTLGLWGPCG
ncbi:hypothetical protein [Brevundimonas sp. Root1279]|uniref:hypothetical protein n=1 Tax=Brevundimonas sp. Root1279 TaxID=1736443 RepID=UPI0012E3F196|nr:hypothetical protein [Brevundimonas sp. Root1279]